MQTFQERSLLPSSLPVIPSKLSTILKNISKINLEKKQLWSLNDFLIIFRKKERINHCRTVTDAVCTSSVQALFDYNKVITKLV
jgi:hypothetical protein